MFAVPGWNITAPLKTQTEADLSGKSNTGGEAHAAAGKKNGSKKRKRGANLERGEGEKLKEIDGEDFAQLWARVVEGKGKTEKGGGGEQEYGEERKKTRQEKKDKKKRKEMKAEEEIREKIEDFNDKREKIMKKAMRRKDREKVEKSAVQSSDKEIGSSTDAAPLRILVSEPQPVTRQPPPSSAAPVPIQTPKLTPLQKSMQSKLASARFRHLNEKLYTTSSEESLKLFTESPELFSDYHTGFSQQIHSWPENPADVFVQEVLLRASAGRKKEGKSKGGKKDKKSKGGGQDEPSSHDHSGFIKPLPRSRAHLCAIADLGCGTAHFASKLQPKLSSLKLYIDSFDLANPTASPLITTANITGPLPLPDSSIDIAICCLALMGSDWPRAIDEAHRIVRPNGGELWVAEIKSRFGRAQRAEEIDAAVLFTSSRDEQRRLAREKEAQKRRKQSRQRVVFPGLRNHNNDASSSSADDLDSDEERARAAREADAEDQRRAAARAPLQSRFFDPSNLSTARAIAAAASPLPTTTTNKHGAGLTDSTDLSHFLRVLERRGFALDYNLVPGTASNGESPAEKRRVPAVERRNKMFVWMRFVRVDRPGDLQNNTDSSFVTAAARLHANANANGNVSAKKFIDRKRKDEDEGESEEGDVKADAKALKPCVYKLR